MILILLGVDSKALRNKVDLHSIDVLNQTSDRGHQLLPNVPVNVRFESSAINYLVEAVC